MTELEALREFLQDAAAAFDARQEKVLEPVDRLKQLLAAKDKRATLLEMAGDDTCCIALSMRAAGQSPTTSRCACMGPMQLTAR